MQRKTYVIGCCLAGVLVAGFSLPAGWSRGDDDVLKAVVGLGALNRDQKGILRMHLNERYMRSVWEHNQPLQDFLGNDDYASPGASM